MKLPTLSRKTLVILGTVVLVLVAGTIWCNRAHAADAPAPAWDLFIPVTMNYVDGVGVAGGFGGMQKSSGLLLMGQVSYNCVDGQTGSVTYAPGDSDYGLTWPQPPPPVVIPYTTKDRDFVGFSFTIGIPLRKAH